MYEFTNSIRVNPQNNSLECVLIDIKYDDELDNTCKIFNNYAAILRFFDFVHKLYVSVSSTCFIIIVLWVGQIYFFIIRASHFLIAVLISVFIVKRSLNCC